MQCKYCGEETNNKYYCSKNCESYDAPNNFTTYTNPPGDCEAFHYNYPIPMDSAPIIYLPDEDAIIERIQNEYGKPEIIITQIVD